MYANTCWGLLGLAVTFGLAVLSLGQGYEWLAPYFSGAAVACGAGSLICFAWPLRQKGNRHRFKELCTHPLKAAKLIEPSHILILALAVALGAAIWDHMRKPAAAQVAFPPASETTRFLKPLYSKKEKEDFGNGLYEMRQLFMREGLAIANAATAFLDEWGDPRGKNLKAEMAVRLQEASLNLQNKTAAFHRTIFDDGGILKRYPTLPELKNVMRNRENLIEELQVNLNRYVAAIDVAMTITDPRQLEKMSTTAMEPNRIMFAHAVQHFRNWIEDVRVEVTQTESDLSRLGQ